MEVFLKEFGHRLAAHCLLHVRGGVSGSMEGHWSSGGSSPRPWRCFQLVASVLPAIWVFSTSVEVFPQTRWIVQLLSVFSTSVEVFLYGHAIERSGPRLLHVRGGVSGGGTVKAPAATVFSTSVEVFLALRTR